MANESIRIKTTPGQSKNIRFKLEQDFDFLEILSLKISQEELYQPFCANYGVVVGRVIANKGFGVPNAKISIFIPITNEDQKNELIKDLYPFKTPFQKDKNGIRYNLLLSKSTCILNTPVGTFPSKEEVLDNDVVLEVFDKYYKYTTKTNYAGDFMIFGVPVGQYTIHMDLDMSDIGAISVRPYDLIDEGYPEKLFQSRVEFKSSSNLDSLPQIKTGNKGIEVIPFWGDSETCEIGITRADFDTGIEIKPNALFFGSVFTDSGKMALNKGCNPRNDQGEQDNLRTGEGRIEMIRAVDYNLLDWINNYKITPTELAKFTIDGGDLIDKDGTFAFSIPMNLGHVITDEYGNLIPSTDPSVGIATKGMYRFKMNFTEANENPKFRTAHMLFPSLGRNFGGTKSRVNPGSTGADQGGTEDQRFSDKIGDYKNPELDFHLFEWKQVYTIAHYIKKYKKGGNRFSHLGIKNTDVSGETNLFPFTTAIWKFDILYYIISFIIDIVVLILKLFIILITWCVGVCFRLRLYWVKDFGSVAKVNIKVEIDVEILPLTCFEICPFRFLTNLFPTLPSGSGRGFFLPCEGGGPTGEGYEIPLSSCSNITFCNPNPCSGCNACIKFGDNGAGNINTNNCLQSLQKWECCVKYNVAESRNVIRRSFHDAWVFGTAYLFQFKYKKKKNGKEKFCGPGADHVRGDNYKRQKCCLDSPCQNCNPATPNDPNGVDCDRCLVRGPGKTANHAYFGIKDYHQIYHNTAITGANDINDLIYCNALMPTKIVSLGRIEMCQETLEQIEMATYANQALRKFTQNPQFYTGTFFENGWDPGFFVSLMKESSYEDPRDVILWLANNPGINCQLREMFYGSIGQDCHEYEFKDNQFYYVKEISKIYTDIQTTIDPLDGEHVFNFQYTWAYVPAVGNTLGNTLADSPNVDLIVVNTSSPYTTPDPPPDGGYEVVAAVGDKFSPCGGNGNCYPNTNWSVSTWPVVGYQELSTNFLAFDSITSPSSRNNINTRSNIPYYYFGIKPGRTAINKLRKDFFVEK